VSGILRFVLGLSLAGGATCLAVCVLGLPFRRLVRKSWLYYLWLVVLLRFAVPVPLNLPFITDSLNDITAAISSAAEPAPAPAAPDAAPISDGAGQSSQAAAEKGAAANAGIIPSPATAAGGALPLNNAVGPAAADAGAPIGALALRLLPYIWLAGMSAMALWSVAGYALTLRGLRRGRILLAPGRVPVYESCQITTPILAGLLRPAVYLPAAFQNPGLAVRHELTHLRRGDIWLRWLAQLALCVHWFNPLAWLMKRELDRLCELACDSAVIACLDQPARRGYGQMLLDTARVISDGSGALVASLGRDRRLLTERLGELVSAKKATKKTVAAMSALTALILSAAVLFGALFTGCASNGGTAPVQASPAASDTDVSGTGAVPAANNTPDMSGTGQIAPYSDVRVIPGNHAPTEKIEVGNYDPADIKTFWFNGDTVFPGSEDLAAKILENGKYPGLGVEALHDQGITGKGVNVAIIDQNLAQPFHPEFVDRIAAYTDVGTSMSADAGSMHGPAVASLLVGKSCGVAPGADLYFAAAPSWTEDSEYYAKALLWIIEKNSTLPENDKIRVVSVSAAPSGDGSPFKKNLEMWDDAVAKAQAAGILVLDCRVGDDTGIVAPGYYDPEAPDDVARFKPGFPQHPVSGGRIDGVIVAPTSGRSTAEAYTADHNSYQYTGQGGLSWAIPYAAGVLALGWQVDPTLTNDEIVSLLFSSAYTDADGNRIINPPAFIKAVQSR
jgi:serine protease AprX